MRSLFRRQALEADLSRELAFHVEELKAENLAAGMTEQEAEAAARAAFGSPVAIAEECRDQRRTQWLEDVLRDTRFALRGIRKSPAFTAGAVLTLALGIGANAAFFTLAYGVLLRPLPYPEPGGLVQLEDGLAGMGPVTTLRELSGAVDWAGHLPGAELDLLHGSEACRLSAAVATANLARVLQVQPVRGRWFRPEEERAGRHRVAVLSDRTWRLRFAADPAVVGRRILLNEQTYEVVGIMPPSFAFPSPETELWIPIRLDPRNVGEMWGLANLWPIGRLRPGFSPRTAQAEVAPVTNRIRGMFPWRVPDEYGRGAWIAPLGESLVRTIKPKLQALCAGALLLLLIACGTVANLLLARSVGREREFAMREALGAGRGRLLRQALTENLVLGLLGCAAGWLLAALILRGLPLLLPRDTPRLHEAAAGPALLATTGLTLLVTLATFAAAPLLRLLRTRHELPAGRAVTSTRRQSRAALALVAVELALATALLIGAGLMGRTLWRLTHAESGIRADGVVTARLSAGVSRCGPPDRCLALIEDIGQTLRALPGVRTVSWASVAPLEQQVSAVSLELQDHPRPPGAPAYVFFGAAVTPEYFATLGIPLRAGRLLNRGDLRNAPPVVVISESTARRLWPRGDAVGKLLRPSSNREWMTVVGVVGDVAQYSLAGFPPWVDGVEYVPLAQALYPGNMRLWSLLSSGQPDSTAAALAVQVQRRFPGVVVSRVAGLDAIRADSIVDQRSTSLLLGLFAFLGLALSASGVYGVISHRMAQRTREMELRIALGAAPHRVVAMVLGETLLTAAAGLAAGVGGALALSRFLSALLFGVGTHDPLTFTAGPLILLGVAAAASAIPALRAARTDPARTLRAE